VAAVPSGSNWTPRSTIPIKKKLKNKEYQSMNNLRNKERAEGIIKQG
jgi:hypothetical protein